MTMTKIIVTGSIGYDFIMNFNGRFADRIMPDKIHKLSLSFLADKLNKQIGGTATNIAYTLRLLGLDPNITATVGKDEEEYFEFLKKTNLRTEGIVKLSTESTSTYFCITDSDDNQIGSFYSGAMKYNKKLKISQGFVVISPNDPKAMIKFVKECMLKKFRFLYDPAFQIGNFSKDELQEGIDGAEIVIGNDYEVGLMEQRLDISHEELVLASGILITTMGAKGSIIETRHDQIHIKPAKPKNTSDPTGAGDAYRGGFLAGYLRGFDLETCGRMGSVAAVYTVEKYGTVTHTYSKKLFEERYFENYKQKINLSEHSH